MSETSKKQTFLHGTALLALATAAVKLIGALYKIPLNAIIGVQGFGYFNTAYQIYNVLLMISTAGLPVAMSRMISQASSLGNYRQVRKVYTTARAIFIALGLISAVLMGAFAPVLAEAMGQPNATAAIAILAPSSFLICLMSTYRGFFQGQGNMKPTSISQVLEAVIKLIVGIAAAVLIKFYTDSIPLAAGGAIFGVTMSCLISSFYLNHCYRKAARDLPVTQDDPEPTSHIAKGLLAIAIPITIGSAGLQLLTTLETGIYMDRLFSNADSTMGPAALLQQLEIYKYVDQIDGKLISELTRSDAIQFVIDTQKGIYDMTMTIFNMPCAFITPITISIIPAITAQITTGDHKAAKTTGESAARVTALISMPCAMGLLVLAEPVTALLGGYSGAMLTLATSLMRVLGVCIAFNAIVLLTNAIMQAHGHVVLPVINMFVGGFLKLAAIWILTGNPHIGILGTPIGSLLCYASITILNLITMRRILPQAPAILKNILRGFLSAAIMGIITFGCWYGLKMLGIGSSIILCGGPIMVGVVVYLVCAIKLRAITREDCLLLPKGQKIADLLHL
ncbi:MAG: polysaccharide biosynthesis protein [Oscillospiraceae bacterium]|nr:polysaccharide biosynthesis protein [Oscillospiraceae bacterium]